jgi:hypothetical protein
LYPINEDNSGHPGLGDCGLCRTGFVVKSRIRSFTNIYSRRFRMTKQTLKHMVWLLCISVALTACKEKPEIIEVVRAIKTVTVSEQAVEKIFKFSGPPGSVSRSADGLRWWKWILETA